MKKVSILGWYGHSNLGDEAMLEALEYLFTKYFGVTDFNVFTDYEHQAVPTFNSKLANDADLFVLGGGELINRTWLYLLDVPQWEKYVTIPKIILGCGVNAANYEVIQDHVKDSLKTFDYIGLRDFASCVMLSSDISLAPKVNLTLPVSIVLPEKLGVTWKPVENVAAIIPTERKTRVYDEGIMTTDPIETSRQKLLETLKVDKVERVILLPFGHEDNDDLATCKRLEEYLKPEFKTLTVEPKTPKDALEIISSCSSVYSYRLHGMIMAYSLGIPFTTFGYHRKVRRVYNTIMQFPLPEAQTQINKSWNELVRILA